MRSLVARFVKDPVRLKAELMVGRDMVSPMKPCDVQDHIRRDITRHLAEVLMRTPKFMVSREDEFHTYATRYRVEMYAFTKEELEVLLNDVYSSRPYVEPGIPEKKVKERIAEAFVSGLEIGSKVRG